ncbi:AMP-binding protein [Xanthobacteraceae bacterium A53D]
MDHHLQPRAANHRPLTPVEFLMRAVEVFPERPALAWRDGRWSYGAFGRMVARFLKALRARGIGPGDVVSVMATNRPELILAHYAVPLAGAVLNTINTRLDAETVGYILAHSESRLLIADSACLDIARAAAAETAVPCLVLPDDPAGTTAAAAAAGLEGLDLLTEDGADLPALDTLAITDEWQPICLNYTSGTTGRPKGVVYHHRGAYLNALGNVLALKLDGSSAYLWTLPAFHCNGWCHSWAVTAAGALHVCLDKPDPALIFAAIAEHGVSHFACAPVVLYMLLNHPARATHDAARRISIATGGASPTSALIEQLNDLGFELTHLYGLTESFGPATLCDLDAGQRQRPAAEQAALLARQGVRHVTASRVRVLDDQGADVPADGATLGEITLSGNTLMAGYYRDPDTTAEAFRGDVFHTGDLAVRHPDGAIEIRDRAKDIIISGGENISSLEIESVLHRHPAVLLAAVVAAPDEKWGERPVAFIELRADMSASTEDLRAFCRERLAGFKAPQTFIFGEVPKTATGKIQKFALREQAKAAGAGR